MPSIKREWWEITKSVIFEFQEQMNRLLVDPVVTELPEISVEELAPDFFKKMQDLSGFANEISISLGARSSELADLPIALVPVFKALFLRARLAKASELDQQRSKTTNPQVIAALEKKLKPYDGIIREEWFQAAEPEYPPALSDVLHLERVEELDIDARPPERQYDEKFHVLQAPTLFLPDLHYYRGKCGVRDVPVAIAFLDIDKFKEFNTALGEIDVDQHVLPVFMRSVEAHIYGHGYAYRFGGDEYALLMPNTDFDLAVTFVNGVRKRLAELTFVGTGQKITVSVGLCVADRDCSLTGRELLQRAQKAKDFAKKKGRDCVARYAGKLFDTSELQVITG